MTGVVQRLKCRLGFHDWQQTDAFHVDHEEEIDGYGVVHWHDILPVRWECEHCGATDQIEFSKLEARDSDGDTICSWRAGE